MSVSMKIARICFYILCGFIFIFLVFPIIIVFPLSLSSVSYLQFPPETLSLRWYQSFFADSQWIRSTLLSLRVGVITAFFASILGILAATGLNRSNFRGKDYLMGFLIMPMVVPLIVMAIGMYNIFARWGMVGSTMGIVLAHTVRALPYVIINVSAAYQTMDRNLEWAARSLGANPFQTFMKVTYPLIKPGIIGGAFFAFIVSYDELILSLFLSGVRTKTLPIKMWDGIRMEMTPIIAAASSIIIIVYISLYLIFELSKAGSHLNTQRAKRKLQEAKGGVD